MKIKLNLSDEILSAVTIDDVLKRYRFKAEKDFINCPFHQDDTASCRIYTDTNSFYCFGCGLGGNVITFVSNLFKKNKDDAIKIINEDFKLNLPIDRKMTIREKRFFERKIAERKKKEQIRQQIQQEKAKSFGEYLDLQKEYLRLKENLIKYKPIDQDSPLNPFFVEAVQNIDTVEFKLDQMESKVINFVF